MIGATLGAFVLAGILSTFLMLNRSGARLSNYNTMQIECRRALEEFSQDVRMASNVTFNGSSTSTASSITLTLPDNYASSGNQVTYAYDSSSSGANANTFYRLPGNASSTAARTVLVRNVTSCVFSRFNRLDAATTTDAATKRVELSLKTRIQTATTAAATESAMSATYVLRNKPAS